MAPVPKRYQFGDEMLTVTEIVKLTGRRKATILHRRRGDKILTDAEAKALDARRKSSLGQGTIAPTHSSVYETADGKTLSITGWAAELQIPVETLKAWRFAKGMTMEEIIEKVRTDYEPRPYRRVRPLIPREYNREESAA